LIRRLLPFLLFANALPLVAAQKSFVMPLISKSNWQLTGSRPANMQELQKLGSQPPVEQEFGVTSVTERTYEKEGASVTAFFEEAADPSAAYGLFTFYQNSDMRPVEGVQLAVAGSKSALMARGRYLIRFLWPASSGILRGDLRSLLAMIGGAKLTVENAEKLPQVLPKQGLVTGTERYLLGPQAASRVLGTFPVSLIGFQDGVEALAGTYLTSGERLRLLTISYPTPQLALVKYKAMQKELHLNRSRGPGSIYGRLRGSYALLVLNAKSAETANRLLNQFKLSQFLTWSPRYQPQDSTAYQFVTLILANFELIGVIVVFAVLAGILAAFGKRFIIKRFPDSGFSKGQDNQLTRLKLE
jgi:hypothetical protein